MDTLSDYGCFEIVLEDYLKKQIFFTSLLDTC